MRKKFFLVAIILFSSSLLSAQGIVSETYSAGDIPTSYNAYDPTCNGPLTTLSVTLPAGESYEITGIEISYNMTSDNTGYMSDQRSQVHCQNTSTTEPAVYSGVGNSEGTYSYKRIDVDIANGTYAGGDIITFEMRAWRVFGTQPHCGDHFNQVDNNTWQIKVFYGDEIIIPKVGVSNASPEQALHVEGKLKIGDDLLAPTEGTMRYEGGNFEGWNGSAWNQFNNLELGGTNTLIFSTSPNDDNLIDLGFQLDGKSELYGAQSYLGMNEGTYTNVSVPGNIPAKHGHSAVWTGTEMLIWGGTNSDSNDPNGLPGYREVITYNPSTNTWTLLPIGSGAPLKTRRGHSAIWTGSQMIIWGGRSATTGSVNTYSDGYIYDLSTNSWTPLSQSGSIPTARFQHDAIWTGTDMIIHGGGYAIGGKYNLSTGTWSTLPIGPGAMNSVVCSWTGTDMIVIGQSGSTYGAKYNLSANSWTFPLPSNGPNIAAGQGMAGAWTGTEVLIWGGTANAGKYNPSTLNFTFIANEGPQNTSETSAVWTGTEMIIFGGKYDDKPWVTSINSRQCYKFSLSGQGSTYTGGAFKTIYYYKK